MTARSLTSLAEILTSLAALQDEEAELSNSLSSLLQDRDPIIASLSRLHSLLPQLNVCYDEADSLSTTVAATAHTAQRVAGKVKSLDEEMKRIREAADRVAQVIDLKASLADLQSAIHAQDWETAARHCARAMSLPLDVLTGPFAESAVPTQDSHLPPVQTLDAARQHLLQVFKSNFEQASAARDSAATSRFFKLFPAIGWESEGLDAYSHFVVDLVRVRAPPSVKTSSPLYYITALTALFENIALIVDTHQPVVEKYYGPGKMLQVVHRLLQECDRVVNTLVDGWQEERAMKRKLQDVIRRPPVPLSSTRKSEDDPVDHREIDKVLTEVASMAGRWHLFKKFLIENLALDAWKWDTQSDHIFDQLLEGYYTPLEVWYIRTTIDQIHRTATIDVSQNIALSTTPDHVFYILRIVFTRLLSTGSLSTLRKMMDQIRDVMEKEYVGIIKKKMDEVYRAPGSGGKEKTFIMLLNDLDLSAGHVEQLMVRDLAVGSVIPQHYGVREQEDAKALVVGFAALAGRLRAAVKVGVEQLFNQLMRPKLRSFIGEVWKDVSYVLDDDAYSVAEYQDVPRKRFVKVWEHLMETYKESFSDSNYRMYFGLALDVLVRPWEKFMMVFRFTELGAIRFDRDLRSITTYLASQTAFGDAREKFVRLQQMSTLLNLDNEEDVDEFYNGSGIAWKLTPQEARAIVALKI